MLGYGERKGEMGGGMREGSVIGTQNEEKNLNKKSDITSMREWADELRRREPKAPND